MLEYVCEVFQKLQQNGSKNLRTLIPIHPYYVEDNGYCWGYCVPTRAYCKCWSHLSAFSEIDKEGVIEPDTDEPQELGELENTEVKCEAPL